MDIYFLSTSSVQGEHSKSKEEKEGRKGPTDISREGAFKQKSVCLAVKDGAIPSTTRFILANQPTKQQTLIDMEENRRGYGFGVLEESSRLEKLGVFNGEN